MGSHISHLKLTLYFFFATPLLGHVIEEERNSYLDEIFTPNLIQNSYKLITKPEFSFWKAYGNLKLNKTLPISLANTPFCYRPFITGTNHLNQATQVESTFPDQLVMHTEEIGFIHDSETSESNNLNNYSPFFCKIDVSNESEKIRHTHPGSILENLTSVSLIPDFRFKNQIFSWKNTDSLEKIKEEDALIPTLLLDAILQSNFDLFFLQKKSPDQEEFSIFLDTIHGSAEAQISKAQPNSFSDIATYLLIGGFFCMLISRYFKMANQEAFESRNVRGKNVLNERKKRRKLQNSLS